MSKCPSCEHENKEAASETSYHKVFLCGECGRKYYESKPTTGEVVRKATNKKRAKKVAKKDDDTESED